VNVTGTLHVLEAARRLTKIERLVITSSSEVYGPKTVDNIDESHPLNPTSPYAASKVAADRYCYAYSVMCGLPVSIARMFNTFGPRQIYDVVPRFVQMALRGEPITVFGTGEQTRDFMYVTDAVNALLTMGADPRARLRTVNFGTGREISIRSLAKLVKELTGSRSEVVFLPRRTSEVEGLCCNAGLASALLEWRPCVRFEDGLARTIEWARERQQYVARQR
jgi:nucleoside-diphosphate-sugar epimerase